MKEQETDAGHGTTTLAGDYKPGDPLPVIFGTAPGPLKAWAQKMTQRWKIALFLGIFVAILLWVAVIPFAYICWLYWLPRLWGWAGDSVFKMSLSAFASFFLAFGPFYLGVIAYAFSGLMADLGMAAEKAEAAVAQRRVHETEEDALNRLEKSDSAGLLPLLRYSRAQLEAYYVMGLEQTRRSFFHAVIAMWLGFLILLLGVALYVGPVERFGMQRPSADFNIIIIVSAAIVEVISALFLWVYRSTIGQLTFYYRLQMHSHGAILAFRVATSMKESDEAKRAIIASVLDSSLMPERPAVEGSRGLMAMLGGRAPTVVSTGG